MYLIWQKFVFLEWPIMVELMQVYPEVLVAEPFLSISLQDR
jgi:hypothetical protein